MDAKSEIRGLEDSRYAAMIAKDLKTLDRLLGDGLVYTHSNAESDSKASYIEAIKTGKFDYRRAERLAENIHVYGDTAVTTGHVRLEVNMGGTPKTVNSKFLNVWIRGERGWQMVAWQSTPLPT